MHLTVEGMHPFAVGEMQALVHNSSGNTGQSLTELFDNGNRTPKASERVDWAADQDGHRDPDLAPEHSLIRMGGCD